MNESPLLMEMFARQKHAVLEARIRDADARRDVAVEASHGARAAAASALTLLALRLDTRASVCTTLGGR